ncbi:hypothetical protein BG261_08075 [Floricoccus tropicus]|uniref:ABC transporter permease n=1 Tax=Floricoccus tropicus TaxID=1859473 RepID=A0A1E8GJ28_9LACT|nr:hypothetical protein [Floricoccus tropicus]OFI48231.1 hypothetical protein BG261_08075 [Floricoccus tropicus]
MKKRIELVGNFKFVAYALIIFQGILLSILALITIGNDYLDKWSSYPNTENAQEIYIKDIGKNQEQATLNFLLGYSQEHNLFVSRRDSASNKNGDFSGYKFGIGGIANGNNVDFSYLDTNILNTENLDKLLTIENEEATIGIDKGSVNSIYQLPNFRFNGTVVVKKLTQLFKESGTVSGDYKILGFNDEQDLENFLDNLSKISKIDKNKLLDKGAGGVHDNSLISRSIVIVTIVTAMTLVLIFVVIAVRSLSAYGKLSLLGWSNLDYVKFIFKKFIFYTLMLIPVLSVFAYMLSGWGHFSFPLLNKFIFYNVINLLLVIIAISIASLIIMLTNSLNAIHGRIPHRLLYIFGILVYIFIGMGLVASCIYLDIPIKTIKGNVKLAQKWQKYDNYQVLSSYDLGNDKLSNSGQSTKLNENMFNWYKSIADNDGVYLINSTFYSKEIIDNQRNSGAYEKVPTNPFWYFVYSPNFLKYNGIDIDGGSIEEAKQGVRVYLISSELSDKDKKEIEDYYTEIEEKSSASNGDIDNNYKRNKNYKFAFYNPVGDLFTWTTNKDDDVTSRNPVIYLATPENTSFIENESFIARGLENGYIKFESQDIRKKYTSSSIFTKYNLDDNNISFISVSNYIDGISKEMYMIIQFLILILIVVVSILTVLLITLATIYRMVNQEKINVKKFIGYSFWNIYKLPVIFLSIALVIELVAVIIAKSTVGVMTISMVFILQLIIFWRYVSKNEFKNILIAFKER